MEQRTCSKPCPILALHRCDFFVSYGLHLTGGRTLDDSNHILTMQSQWRMSLLRRECFRAARNHLSGVMLLLGLITVVAQQTNSPPTQRRLSHSRLLRHHQIKPSHRTPSVARPANWVFIPDQPGTDLTYSVACGGDINGDGFADVLVGDSEFDHGRGRLLVFYGSAQGLPVKPSAVVEGNSAGEKFGSVVSMLGDLNGDGFDDILLSGWLLYGTCNGLGQRTAWPVATVGTAIGDVNGDGFDDVAVYDQHEKSDSPGLGRVSVYDGSLNGPNTHPDWSAYSEQPGSGFGHDVASAGDVNGDGYDDLLIGAMNFSGRFRNGGKAYLYLGSADGFNRQPNWTAEYPLPIRKDVDEAKEQFFSWSLASAGDVNHDGCDDVIIGACFADHDDINEGLAFIYYGSRRGLSKKPDWWAESNHAHALFGRSVSGAGDVNGDGFDDILIGAPQAMDGQDKEGAAVLYHGSRHGFSRLPQWTMESDHTHEMFGSVVRRAGDINGDGFADVLIAGPGYERLSPDGGVEKLGRVVVAYGGANGSAFSHDWKLEKPLLLSWQQRLEFAHNRYGAVVYWGPWLLLLVAIAGVFVLGQTRLRRRLAGMIEENRKLTLAQERTRLARDVHDHLGAQLTQIALWTDIAKSSASKPDAIAENLERVSGFIKSAITDVSRLVWTMNPANDTVENFAGVLGRFCDRLCQTCIHRACSGLS